MDIKKFIESGILEEYCMGWINEADRAIVVSMASSYSQIREELTRVELFMEQFAKLNAVSIINTNLREKILDSLEHISQNYLDLDNLPIINNTSNYQMWLYSVQHLIPTAFAEDMICEVLRQDDKVTQTLIVSKIGVSEETHTNILESFLILQGECECTIGERVFKAAPGDLIEIPLHAEHDVRLLSPVVVAVLQHQLV